MPTPQTENSVACELFFDASHFNNRKAMEMRRESDSSLSDESIDKDIDERYLVNVGMPTKHIHVESGRGGGISSRKYNESLLSPQAL